MIHNGTVDATTDGKGSVAEMTVEDIKKLDAGSRFSSRSAGTRIPMLREALLAAKGRVNLYLDCKEIDPKQLVDDIRSTHMESQVIVYDSPEVIARIREESNREIATMTKYRPHAMPLEEFIGKVDPAAVEVDADDVSAELCSSFHSRGIKVQAKVLGIAWDRPKVWTKMIDAGVDWLQTDEPAVLRMTEVRRRIKNFPIQIAYHRGANRYAPENTLPAIEKAVALDADYIEIDIRTTRDGEMVLLHDATLNRTTNGTGKVEGRLAAEILSLDAGRWFSAAQKKHSRSDSRECPERLWSSDQCLSRCQGSHTWCSVGRDQEA